MTKMANVQVYKLTVAALMLMILFALVYDSGGPNHTVQHDVSPPPVKIIDIEVHTIPVMVMAYNRPVMLRQCLKSLQHVRGLTMTNVMVYQDGDDPDVAAVVGEFPGKYYTILHLYDTTGVVRYEHPRTRQRDGASYIAAHYGWSLKHFMALTRFVNNTGVIILEDDMTFSNDMYEYFSQTEHLLSDPTVLYA